jgi:hypothetical protein
MSVSSPDSGHRLARFPHPLCAQLATSARIDIVSGLLPDSGHGADQPGTRSKALGSMGIGGRSRFFATLYRLTRVDLSFHDP